MILIQLGTRWPITATCPQNVLVQEQHKYSGSNKQLSYWTKGQFHDMDPTPNKTLKLDRSWATEKIYYYYCVK